MSSKQRRWWWAAALVVALVAAVPITLLLYVTRTASGRARVLALIVDPINRSLAGRGTVSVRELSEVRWNHADLVGIAIVDSAGTKVIVIDSARASVDLYALFDKRIHIRSLDVHGLHVDLRKGVNSPWNFTYIISGGGPSKKSSTPGFGDDVTIDVLHLTSGEITTVAPWSPFAVFTGTARDSVIALREKFHDIARTSDGLFERRRYALDRVVAHDGVILKPNHAPSSIVLDSVRATVADPPIRVTHAAGTVTWTPDSLRFALPHLALPASLGSADGRVWWNQPGSVRYDVAINATASLSDLTWTWDVLPTIGSGSVKLRMRTLDSADDTEYALNDLNVTSEKSNVQGRITIVARPAVILLQKVALTFSPITSELLRRVSYEAVPARVQGLLRGQLLAEVGGTLKNFLIDRLNAQFEDRTVPGALSLITAFGRVSMGVKPAARDMQIDTLQVDLRTLRALAPTLPAIDGVLRGHGHLVAADAVTADISGLALQWIDAAGNISRISGDARVGYGLSVPTFKVALALDPLSFRALARVDSTIKITSAISGQLNATGTLDSLNWQVALRADAAGLVALSGAASIHRVASQISTWRTTANGKIDGVDVQAWLGRADVPVTALSGTLQSAFSGTRDSNGKLRIDDAHTDVALKQMEAAERPAFDLVATGGLDAQRMHLDSATMHIGGITMDAHGQLARSGVSVIDTLEISASADTLDLVRRQLTRLAATMAPMDSSGARSLKAFAADTLSGDATLSGYLVGSLSDFNATVALGARDLQVGAIRVGRIFGSLQIDSVLTRAAFEGAATADAIDGIAAVRIASTEFRVQRATPDSGQLVFDATSANDAHLLMRGSYDRTRGATRIVADSIRFAYDSVIWNSAAATHFLSDSNGLHLDSLVMRSSRKGVFSVRVDAPSSGAITGSMLLDRFPGGEAAAFARGAFPFSGQFSGNATLAGTRAAPLIDWSIVADSLGVGGTLLPRVVTKGKYADRRIVGDATIADSTRGTLRAEARIPIDLSIGAVDKRLLSENLDADITADSLRLDALGITVAGANRLRGVLAGRLAITGTIDRPVATGRMTLEQFAAFIPALGIEPIEGRAVIRAAADSLILESFRARSGRATDTLSARGVLRFAVNQPLTIDGHVFANTVLLAQQRDGTELTVSGELAAVGPLSRPTVTGAIVIPSGTLVFDPLGASTALDLNAEAAREYLLPSELATLESGKKSIASLGKFANVDNVRVELGREVWVRTPEATLNVTGTVSLTTRGEALVPIGEITTGRGQYRLDLGVVSRSFSVDSGRVRFFGDPDLAPTLNLSATNVVRLATAGEEIPVGVHVGGTIEKPIIRLSSSDPLYSSAPESEIISLLIFGAPTFALDGQSQSTVRAVTGVLLPSASGLVEGVLQRLLPVFNTVQVTTAGGQTRDDLSAYSLLDNLSISAGKQIGQRAFLRLNTGVCRGAAQSNSRSSSLWLGVAVEYRLTKGYSAQAGVDPGSAPCSRLGGDLFPRMQFGFDLFREWVF